MQHLYQSKVYTNEINIDFYSLNSLNVSNFGGDFKVVENQKNTIKIGFKVNNIFNNVYYFSNLRPMPGRNYNINLNYKF